jgi:formylglycine-generating enzyme required for sulfatase activity
MRTLRIRSLKDCGQFAAKTSIRPHHPASMTIACLVASLLLGTGGTWLISSAEISAVPAVSGKGNAQVGQTFLTKVFGERRNPDSDLLVLRDGRRVTGLLSSEQFILRTAFGSVSLKAISVAGAQFAGPTDPVSVFVFTNNDQLSGLIEPVGVAMRLPDGRALTVRSEEVARLIRHRLPGEGDSRPQHQFVVLRNGDRFDAQLANKQLKVIVDRTNRVVMLDAVDSIRFSSDYPSTVRVALRDGTSFGADWPEDDLEMTLAIGATVRVHRDWIKVVHARPGFRPLEYRLPTERGASSPQTIMGLVWIPPGRFVMGSQAEEAGRDFDETPITEVTLTCGFWMGEREVSQAEFKALMGTNPSQFIGDSALPVERVNWREAVAYCETLTRRWAAENRLPEGHAFRLPTEAEWEYACRAGATSRFSHGDDPDARRLAEFAWFSDNSDSTSHPVGGRQPNAWGLFDLHGNVLEWCQDAATAYPGGSVTNYVSLSGRSLLRIARGGSWLYGASAARSANRDSYAETTRCSDLGFRVVLAPVATNLPQQIPAAP